MKVRRSWVRWTLGTVPLSAALWAQAPAAVSLAQAQQIALRNHPRIASAELAAKASGFVVKQVRSAYYPTISGNVTGVGTEHGSVL
jgi:outer membrane protein TolC